MNNYQIVVDSTSDLNKELAKKYHIYDDIIRGVIYFPDGSERLSDIEWKDISSDKFYTLLKKNVGAVKTSFATFSEFSRVIKPILDKGEDVIIIAISSGISGTANAYRNYASMILDDYPLRKIEIIDSLKYSGGIALLAIYASLNRDNGMSFDDNVKWLNENKLSLHESGIMDDLSFLAKNGRVSASKAFFGSLIGMQPVADLTLDGKNVPLGTIKGEKNANEFSIRYLKELIVDSSKQYIVISHSQRDKRAKEFLSMLKDIPCLEIITLEVGMSVGVNMGPGLCTYFFIGTPISEGREKEISLFNEIKESL